MNRFPRGVVWLAVATTLGTLAGCRSAPAPVPYARAFPEGRAQDEVLDIQVFKRATTLEFTNTTDRAFGPCTIWLNQRFSLPIDGIAVGQTRVLRLADFRDEFSEPFRDGSFFSTETPERLVIAHIEQGSGETALFSGMIVIGDPS